jgi:hypothetical protein
MKTVTHLPLSEGDIWGRIVHPEAGDLSREAAEALLQLDFSPADHRRMGELGEKASAGSLTAKERREAETYNRVAHLLALLQSKARQSLNARKRR